MYVMKYKILSLVFVLFSLFTTVFSYAADILTKSPDGKTELKVFVLKGQIHYNVHFMGKVVIETSPMIMMVDGKNLTANSIIGKTETYSFNEEYPTRGVHAMARNRFNGTKITVTPHASFVIDTRVFNDGIAF